MASLAQVSFYKSAAARTDLDFPSAGEVAFVGRSNAGKSSAINTLVNRKRLAFTSRTPGRTQQINFFALGDAKYLVDLPGYGYAKVAKSEHQRWGGFLTEYLQAREPLKALVLIMDARHMFTSLDQQMLAWFAPRQLPVHVLLTKSDKLNRQEQQACLREAALKASDYGPGVTVSLFSSLKASGVDALAEKVRDWLDLKKKRGEEQKLFAATAP
ncbi:MAG: YihA family ribosome biogenesis GTP-binding protein [Burkholderiales bacterium]|nr:YihA family ribosome biogenesis GTP-binding protein [Burkholderiales bacterium]